MEFLKNRGGIPEFTGIKQAGVRISF